MTLRVCPAMVNSLAHVMLSGVQQPHRAGSFCGMSTLATDVMQRFHERLKRARRRAGYVHAKDFADSLNVEAPTYRQWERGQASPDLVMLTRICKALNVEPNELLPLAKRKKGPKGNGGSSKSPELESAS